MPLYNTTVQEYCESVIASVRAHRLHLLTSRHRYLQVFPAMYLKVVLIVALMMSSVVCYVVDGGPPCRCTRIYMPVCASDGKTYNNDCEFKCREDFVKKTYGRDLYVARAGRCDGSE